MMERVAVPDDDAKHRMLHIGAAVNMNDENDKLCGKGIFFSSFSFGPAENISMWTNYGIPNEDAVRIKFRRWVFMEWVDDFNAGKIRVYGVDSDGSLKNLSAQPTLIMGDVAYWSGNEGLGKKDHNDGIFIHDRNKFRLSDGTDVKGLKESKPYLFKDGGWNYESEVRLILKFEEDLATRFNRVAVPFDGPLDYLDKNFRKYVWQGPWFTPGTMPKDKAGGHSLSEARRSRYKSKVNMRSVCDTCPAQDKAECKCPFRGQR